MVVYKNKNNGKWYCRLMYKGRRWHKLCAGARDKKEAEVIASNEFNKLVKVVEGLAPDERNDITFKNLTKYFLQYSENNKKDYKRDVAKVKVLLEYFGDKKLAKSILPTHIESFKAKMTEKYSNAYVNRFLACIKTIFNIGIKNNLITINPMKQVKMLKEDNQKIRYLTSLEEKRLMRELPDYLKPIVLCALQTGFRKSNILKLRWELVDLEQGYIEVLKQQNKGHKIIQIPISKKLCDALLSLPKTSEYVFVNPKTNNPYNDVYEPFKKACVKAGIPEFRFHDLRHTVATRMVEKGIDIRVVQEIMAHSTIITTQRYMHPTPKRKLEAIEVLNSYC